MRTLCVCVVATLALLGCNNGHDTGGTGGASASSGSQGSGGAGSTSGSGSTSSGTGGGGGAGGSCMINGQVVPAGGLDPNNPCHVCSPKASMTSWSDAPDGQGCGPGSQCAKGVCTLPAPAACDVHVPGDYTGVQEAVTALRAANTKATVCLADGTYAGNLNLDYGTAELTIVGSSSSKVILDGKVTDPAYLGSPALVRLRGVTITMGVTTSKSLALEGCVIKAAPNGDALRIEEPAYNAGNTPTTATVDGCDISAPGGTAIRILFSLLQCGPSIPLFVTIENSYLHDSKVGVSTYISSACPSGSVTAVHNTLMNDGTGITISSMSLSATTAFVSNVIVGASLGITSDRMTMNGAQVIDDFRDNALFNNTTNYGGLATPGMGYVTMDPKLSGGAPPAPLVGSPLIAAGDPALVTAADYFGVPRKGRADIGAVEGP